MKYNIGFKRITAIAMALVIIFVMTASCFAVNRETGANKTVRIGFFEFGGMFEGAADGIKKSGYCYEYMMQVSVYTGWNYEYVYGSYAELYEKLKNGEIDVLPYTNYNEQRGREVLFSKLAIAQEEYYLAVGPDFKLSGSSPRELLRGRSISTLEGADYNSLLLDYIKAEDIDASIKYYPELSETWDAVTSGEADVTVFTSNAYGGAEWNCITSFGKKPTYIAVAAGRSDLLSELNEAMDLIEVDNPAFLGQLYAEYFSDNPMRKSLSSEELAWLEKHPVLHVGGFNNDAPYLYTVDNETRTATGLTVELVNGIIERLNLGIAADFKGYDSLDDMQTALDSGEIDVIIPFYPDYYIAQRFDLVISNNVRTSNMELVFKKGISYAEALEKIATPATKLGIYYVQDTFPDSEIVGASSIQDAVDRVLNGSATGAVAQNVVLHSIKEEYGNLNYVVLAEGCGTCFAARPENYPLIRILNRGLNYFPESEISAISSKYNLESKITTRAYLASHQEVIIMLVIIFVAMVALTFALVQMNRLKRKADEANRSKTAFLFNMSHDIRTPMNAIIGFTDMAIKHPDDREKVADSLGKARSAGELLLSLINNVLDMSRIESGAAKLEENPEDVTRSFVPIEATMRELADTKNIDLGFEMGDIEDRFVYCDATRCLRIFVNLITNAIKYTDEGGYVKVRCEQAGKKNGYGLYRYTVEDNGIGMSEEFQKHAFEEFAREESSTVSGVQGTGLGLSVCKSFVNMMNGTIECRSRQGEGTCFTVILPFRLQKNQHQSDGEEDDAKAGRIVGGFDGKRVLLVEDNMLNMEIATDILEEEGFTVESADDGTVAVEMMREKGPDYYDYILMDIQMPVMNGYEATRQIRAMYPDARLPIIALSANAFAEDKAASLEAGMNDHVAKPINIDELKAALEKY